MKKNNFEKSFRNPVLQLLFLYQIILAILEEKIMSSELWSGLRQIQQRGNILYVFVIGNQDHPKYPEH